MQHRPHRKRKFAGYNYSPRESIAQKQQKAYQKILLISIVIILIIAGVIKYSNDIIASLSSLWKSPNANTAAENQSSSSNVNVSVIPTIDPLSEYTNQKKITIHGNAKTGTKVELVFNNEIISIDVAKENRFEFTDLNLKTGENTISVHNLKDNGDKAETSETITISLDQKPPEIEIINPKNNATINGSENEKVKIQGKTETQAKVYVNDHVSIVQNDGMFDYQVTLKEGSNSIKIKAVDQAGNEQLLDLKITYSPKS